MSKGEWLTVGDVADELDVSRNTVYGWLEPEDETRPKLPGYRIGGGIWRVRRADLEAFVEAGRNVPETPEVQGANLP